MTDLPANVDFPENIDGWTLDQGTDSIASVQAFLSGSTLTVELWGTVTAVSPGGKRYDTMEFQQNCDIDLRRLTWTARRAVYGVTAESHSPNTRDGALNFQITGGSHDIVNARRV